MEIKFVVVDNIGVCIVKMIGVFGKCSCLMMPNFHLYINWGTKYN